MGVSGGRSERSPRKGSPPPFGEAEPSRVDIDARRVETPIREGDRRTESNITQPDERYPQTVPGQEIITRGSSRTALLDPQRTTDAFLWSLVPHANRRPTRTGRQAMSQRSRRCGS